jgi:hypothetical protein
MTDIDTRNRPVNIGYLVIGLVFVGLSLTWLLDETGVIEPDGYEWLVPAILLGAGLIGLFASLSKGILSRTPTNDTNETPYAGYSETQPILDLTSDIDTRLEEHTKNGETS